MSHDIIGNGKGRQNIMHELQLAREIIAIVQQELVDRHLSGVTEVGVNLGAISGANPEALTFSFEASVAETPLAGCRLKVAYIPVRGNCRCCRKDFELDDFIFICPHCGSSDIEITDGQELTVSYLVEK